MLVHLLLRVLVLVKLVVIIVFLYLDARVLLLVLVPLIIQYTVPSLLILLVHLHKLIVPLVIILDLYLLSIHDSYRRLVRVPTLFIILHMQVLVAILIFHLKALNLAINRLHLIHFHHLSEHRLDRICYIRPIITVIDLYVRLL